MTVARKAVSGALALALVAGLLASTASAALVIEVRRPGEPGPGGGIEVTPGAGPIDLEMWAVITEGGPGDPPAAAGTLQAAFGGAKSSDGGLILGDMTLTVAPPGAPFIEVDATPHDLDGDGDMDGGDPTQPGAAGFLYWSWNIFVPPFGSGTVETHIGNIQFTPAADWGPGHNPTGPSEVTWIVPIEPMSNDGAAGNSLWERGGPPANEAPAVPNGGVFLYAQSAADTAATPAGQVVDPGADLVLDGSAATGSINWWRWEFDGDPALAVEQMDDPIAILTMDELIALGLSEGAHTVTMTVGYVASPAENVSTSAPIDFTIVPEPATLALVGLGLAAIASRKRK